MKTERVLAVACAALAIAACGTGTTKGPGAKAGAVSSQVTRPLPDIPSGSDVVFYGDSYTASVNASSPAAGYATKTATAFGWKATIIAGRGSGFANGHATLMGTFGERFETQLRPVLAGAKLLIVQDGLNDTNATPVRDAAIAFFAMVRRSNASVPVVLLGPVAPSGTPSASQAGVDQMLQAAAKSAGVVYISPIREHWITSANAGRFFEPGQIHPIDAGYAYIASRLVQDLTTLGARGR